MGQMGKMGWTAAGRGGGEEKEIEHKMKDPAEQRERRRSDHSTNQ
jgi:hypothetical protein